MARKVDLWRSLLDRGLALQAKGDHQKALVMIRRAHERARTEPSAVLALARVEFLAGDRDAALELFRQALELKPVWPVASAMWTRALAQLGRMAEAEHVLAQALEQSPDAAPLHLVRGALDRVGRDKREPS